MCLVERHEVFLEPQEMYFWSTWRIIIIDIYHFVVKNFFVFRKVGVSLTGGPSLLCTCFVLSGLKRVLTDIMPGIKTMLNM